MAIITTFEYTPFDESDPDDYRPSSQWVLLVDPEVGAGPHVDDMII